MVEGAQMKNSKFQIPSSKFSPTASGLEFAGWNFLGTWNLELGISSP
jgi:hypothetical protein